jgi:hypothetical protein
MGFGAVPGNLLRIVEQNGRTTGELARWWWQTSLGDSALQAQFVERMRTTGCGRILRGRSPDGEQVEVCRMPGSETVDWAAMLHQVDSLAIWTLPHPTPSTDPLSVFQTFDGVSMVVELRDGRSYRTHHSPDFMEPEWREQTLQELHGRAGLLVGEFLSAHGYFRR